MSTWQEVSAKRRQKRDDAIKAWDTLDETFKPPSQTYVRDVPYVSGCLSTEELAITDMLPSRLLQKLATGVLSSEEVLRAFIKRAILAQRLTNPLTEIMFDWGLERAKSLDRFWSEHRRPVGPFHGLPISLKDVINLKGIETTLGYIGWVDKLATCDDTIAEVLSAGGAVFYCKTNVPQTLMSGECCNFLFGRTTSPFNTQTSAGGSSGGEGSLVSLGGSPLGVGSDIAGSINTPANHNGIYGLCPSTERLPLHGAHNAFENLIVKAVAGPLSRSVDGLEVYVKGVLSLEPWTYDASCLNMPWNQGEYDRFNNPEAKLCFGFIQNDGVVTPHPPIQRGMKEAMAALKAAGHHVIEMPSFLETVADSFEQNLMGVLGACGNKGVKDILAIYDEPLSPEIVLTEASEAMDTRKFLTIANNILRLRQKYARKWLETAADTPTGRPVDVFILPSGGHVAPPHGTMGYLLYEAISNLLDWTCATIPVGFVDQELDKRSEDDDWKPLSKEDADNWRDCRFAQLIVGSGELTSFADSPKKYENVPVCLQVLGQRHTEEKVLACLRVIDRALGRGEDYHA